MLELSTVLPTAMFQNFVEHQEYPLPLPKRMSVGRPVTSLVTRHHYDHQNSDVLIATNLLKLLGLGCYTLLVSPEVRIKSKLEFYIMFFPSINLVTKKKCL